MAALDPRGVGATDKTPHGYAIGDAAADVLAVVRALGAPAVLVGHGWGGLTAQAAADLGPDLVSGLALLAAPGPRDLQGYRRLVLAARLGATGLGPGRLARWASWPELTEDAPCRVGLAEWPGPHRAVAPLRTATPGRLRAVGTPGVPTLRVRARADRLLPRPAPGAELVDGGHWLPEESPAAVASVLTRWLPR